MKEGYKVVIIFFKKDSRYFIVSNYSQDNEIVLWGYTYNPKEVIDKKFDIGMWKPKTI